MQSSLWSVLMLLLVVGSIPLALWALKRLQVLKTGGQKQLEMLYQLSVGPREKIAIVQVHDRQILVGITPHQISLLVELEQTVAGDSERKHEADSISGKSLAFAQALANTRAGLKNEK